MSQKQKFLKLVRKTTQVLWDEEFDVAEEEIFGMMQVLIENKKLLSKAISLNPKKVGELTIEDLMCGSQEECCDSECHCHDEIAEHEETDAHWEHNGKTVD